MPSSRSVSVAVIAVCLLAFVRLDLGSAWEYLDRGPGDFANYHRAGAALAEGESPYASRRFDYPPLMAFLAAPLGALPEKTARRIWFGLTAAAIVGCGLLTWSLAGGGPVTGAIVAVVWVAGGTIAENLALGQVTPVVLLLVLAAIRIHRARPGLGGALLGIAVALKIWPAVLGALWVLRRRGRALVGLALTTATLTLGPLLLLVAASPPPHAPTSMGYWLGTPAPLNLGLPGVALRLADPPRAAEPLPDAWRRGNDPERFSLRPVEAIPGLLAALVAVGIALAALRRSLRRRFPSAGTDTLALLILLSLCPLVSPISWYHYQIVQLPVVAFLAAQCWIGSTGLVRLGRLTGLAVLLALLTHGHRAPLAPGPVLILGTTAVAAAANVALVAWAIRRLGRSEAPLAAPSFQIAYAPVSSESPVHLPARSSR